MKGKKIFYLVIVMFLFVGLLTGCGSTSNDNQFSNGSNSNNNYNDDSNNSGSTNTNTKKKYTLGDTITFDGLELTFDKEYTFTKVSNKYSDKNGRNVIKLGVAVKNVSEEKKHLNMFYYDFFGSQGTELDGVSSYFDETVDYAGDLKSGASYKKYFYILYDGDGTYSIDFDNYSEEVSVEFKITK